MFKSGFVAILGRPNVGKSTLLNALIGDKVSIISPIPQTTRHQIKGILNLKDVQVVFIDTPGMHYFNDELAQHLNTVAKSIIYGCDLILYVVDVTRNYGKEEERLMNIICNQDIKVIMVLNKVDKCEKFFNEYLSMWQKKIKGDKKKILLAYMPLSAKRGTNIDKLKEVLIGNIPEGPAYYDDKAVTDFPVKLRIADIIREKLFLALKEELPHAVAVSVEEINNKKNVVYIKANIYVRRKSQKMIVVGKKGELLKHIGTLSRKEIETIYEKKVFLDIWVTIMEDWQKRPRILKDLGYE